MLIKLDYTFRPSW